MEKISQIFGPESLKSKKSQFSSPHCFWRGTWLHSTGAIYNKTGWTRISDQITVSITEKTASFTRSDSICVVQVWWPELYSDAGQCQGAIIEGRGDIPAACFIRKYYPGMIQAGGQFSSRRSSNHHFNVKLIRFSSPSSDPISAGKSG